MILHLVTDRRQLGGARSVARLEACLHEQVRQAVAAGIDLVQVRESDLDGRLLARLVTQLLQLTVATSTRLVVNDRLDVALAVGADGVHLRATSMAAERVRRSVPARFLIGRSVHSVAEAHAAGPVDYLVAGSVWRTGRKASDHPVIGLDGLASIARVTTVPVVAIGGLVPARTAGAVAAGAAGVAAIGAWLGEADAAGCRAAALHETAHAFRAAGRTGNMGGTVDRP